MVPNVLTVAGSDPGGGAGIQADLKTFSALGCYGTAVITGLTAQNTREVRGIHGVPPDFVRLQLDTLLDDIRIDAAKTGMLGSAAVVSAVATTLRRREVPQLVVDPVMVAKSGDALLEPEAVSALRELLLPLAAIVTPNLPEVGVLLSRDPPRTMPAMERAARDLLSLGPRAVLIKGGHLQGARSTDLFCDAQRMERLPARRLPTRNTHGTGCTLAAAITALLPQRGDPLQAVRDAKGYLTEAIRHADHLSVGSGHGPVHHFHAWWGCA